MLWLWTTVSIIIQFQPPIERMGNEHNTEHLTCRIVIDKRKRYSILKWLPIRVKHWLQFVQILKKILFFCSHLPGIGSSYTGVYQLSRGNWCTWVVLRLTGRDVKSSYRLSFLMKTSLHNAHTATYLHASPIFKSNCFLVFPLFRVIRDKQAWRR